MRGGEDENKESKILVGGGEGRKKETPGRKDNEMLIRLNVKRYIYILCQRTIRFTGFSMLETSF